MQLLASPLTTKLYSQFVSGQTVYSGSKSETVSNETDETELGSSLGRLWPKDLSGRNPCPPLLKWKTDDETKTTPLMQQINQVQVIDNCLRKP